MVIERSVGAVDGVGKRRIVAPTVRAWVDNLPILGFLGEYDVVGKVGINSQFIDLDLGLHGSRSFGLLVLSDRICW